MARVSRTGRCGEGGLTMAYRDIVVHLAQDTRSQVRLEAAIELAERHEGRVTGVYVLPRLVVPGFASFELSTEV